MQTLEFLPAPLATVLSRPKGEAKPSPLPAEEEEESTWGARLGPRGRPEGQKDGVAQCQQGLAGTPHWAPTQSTPSPHPPWRELGGSCHCL